MEVMEDKPIHLLYQLRDFVISTIYAIGDVSKIEAEFAIDKTFEEFRMKILDIIEYDE